MPADVKRDAVLARRQACDRFGSRWLLTLGAVGGGIRDMLPTQGVSRTLATSSLLQSGQDLFQFYLPVYAHGIGLPAVFWVNGLMLGGGGALSRNGVSGSTTGHV
jgi:hypothetical protein